MIHLFAFIAVAHINVELDCFEAKRCSNHLLLSTWHFSEFRCVEFNGLDAHFFCFFYVATLIANFEFVISIGFTVDYDVSRIP